jgi:hypothetical protein
VCWNADGIQGKGLFFLLAAYVIGQS